MSGHEIISNKIMTLLQSVVAVGVYWLGGGVHVVASPHPTVLVVDGEKAAGGGTSCC